jgi:hypothetical protein
MMCTDLLVTTAYHPQSDGQSERTNQTVEMALRYLVNVRNTDWAEYLAEVEFHINNSVSAATNVSPMEYLTGIKARTIEVAALPSSSPAVTTWTEHRQTIRQEARDAIVYAQTKMAMYYDKNHQPLSMAIGNLAYVNLQKDIGKPGYKLPIDSSTKLGPRRVGPFKILRKIGKLTYELDIPKNWKIHPTISVAHLEPAKEDTYHRATITPPDIINDDDGSHEEWEVEEILRSRWRDKKNKRNKQYYIKWKGYGPEHNEWVSADDLKNSPDLVETFESSTALVAFVSTILSISGSDAYAWSGI